MRNTGLSIHWTRPKWVYRLEGVDVLLDENKVAFLGSSGSVVMLHPPGEFTMTLVLRAFRKRPNQLHQLSIPPGGIRKVELKYSHIWGKLRVWINPTV